MADRSVPEELTLQQTLDRKRQSLEVVAQRPEAKSWLEPCAETEVGTERLMEELERRVDRQDFATALERERQQATGHDSTAPTGSEVLQADWWQPASNEGSDTLVTERTGDWVLVEHDTVVDALAAFIAAYIVTLPEAKDMSPRQLQAAVQQTLRELRKGRVRRLWDWGRYLYRAAALGYGAFAAYTNPWIAEAVLKAVFTCARYARMFW